MVKEAAKEVSMPPLPAVWEVLVRQSLPGSVKLELVKRIRPVAAVTLQQFQVLAERHSQG